jgi:hypothetical protein
MSEFMKRLVNEILEKNGSPKHVSQPADAACTGTNRPSAPLGTSIERPNYQRDKSRKRLAPLYEGGNISAPASKPQSFVIPKTKKDGAEASSRSEYLSSLQRLSLFQVWNKEGHLARAEAAELIGRTREGMEIWFYSGLHPKLTEFLNQSGTHSRCMGVVTCRTSRPGHLFIVDALLGEEPEIRWEVDWDEPFQLWLEAGEPDRLKTMLREIYQRLNRLALRKINTYQSERPSPLLREKMGLEDSRSVAVIEGVSKWEAIALLDRYLKSVPECSLWFAPEQDYLLLQGEKEAVQAALARLKQEADRLS